MSRRGPHFDPLHSRTSVVQSQDSARQWQISPFQANPFYGPQPPQPDTFGVSNGVAALTEILSYEFDVAMSQYDKIRSLHTNIYEWSNLGEDGGERGWLNFNWRHLGRFRKVSPLGWLGFDVPELKFFFSLWRVHKKFSATKRKILN